MLAFGAGGIGPNLASLRVIVLADFGSGKDAELVDDVVKPYDGPTPAKGPPRKGFELAQDGDTHTAEYFHEEKDTGTGLRHLVNKWVDTRQGVDAQSSVVTARPLLLVLVSWPQAPPRWLTICGEARGPMHKFMGDGSVCFKLTLDCSHQITN